jgi:hypothetical protein
MANLILSTGDIRQNYTIIDPVFAYGSSNDGFLKTANPLEAYSKVADLLKDRAAKMGADGIIHATFDYRVAAKTGCGGGKAFEVFAYGTAVKLAVESSPA